MENTQPERAPLTVGQRASLDKTITARDLELFGEVSLDRNPVHFDAELAAKTRFGGVIAHGMIPAGLISAVIGTRLPGPGSIYLGQTLQFRRPVRIGDTLTATATVTALREDKAIATLETVVTNQADEVVLKGEATVLYAELLG